MLRKAVMVGALASGAALIAAAGQAQDKKWYPFPVEAHDPPFNMEGPKVAKEYTPLQKADKKWNICVSFPHMKDAYWLAVDYGVSEERRTLVSPCISSRPAGTPI